MNRLKELRKEKKYTQAQIAELMDVNVKTISRWENGESQIKSAQAKMLADFLGQIQLICQDIQTAQLEALERFFFMKLKQKKNTKLFALAMKTLFPKTEF